MQDADCNYDRDRDVIDLGLTTLTAVVVGTTFGLLTGLGGVVLPLAVLAGLSAAGVTFSGTLQLLRSVRRRR